MLSFIFNSPRQLLFLEHPNHGGDTQLEPNLLLQVRHTELPPDWIRLGVPLADVAIAKLSLIQTYQAWLETIC
jgi:hypothetical protein